VTSNPKVPDSDAIDAELELAIACYDRKDKYPEWSNSAMREAYRAGWEDGASTAREALAPIRELHRQEWFNCINACCIGKECRHRSSMCTAGCDESWPCPTAKLVYTDDELTGGDPQ